MRMTPQAMERTQVMVRLLQMVVAFKHGHAPTVTTYHVKRHYSTPPRLEPHPLLKNLGLGAHSYSKYINI